MPAKQNDPESTDGSSHEKDGGEWVQVLEESISDQVFKSVCEACDQVDRYRLHYKKH